MTTALLESRQDADRHRLPRLVLSFVALVVAVAAMVLMPLPGNSATCPGGATVYQPGDEAQLETDIESAGGDLTVCIDGTLDLSGLTADGTGMLLTYDTGGGHTLSVIGVTANASGAVLNAGDAGGVLHSIDSDVFVDTVLFDNGLAPNGAGGIYVSGGNLEFLNAVVEDSDSAAGFGGLFVDGDLTITDARVQRNTGFWVGGAFGQGLVDVSSSLFDGNTGEVAGGLLNGANNPGGGTVISATEFVGNDSTDGSGGAVHVHLAALLISSLSEFENNTADEFGGGVFVDGDGTQTVEITDSSFDNNETRLNGGAVHVVNASSVTVVDTDFDQNSTTVDDDDGGGGAIYVADSGEVDLSDSLFTDNSSATDGGGVNLVRTGAATVSDAAFIGNSANDADGANGGALDFDENSDVTIERSLFRDNTSADDGGAVDFGSAATGNASIIESIFEDNDALATSSNDGGGAIRFGSEPTISITSSTFSGNSSSGAGGAILFDGAHTTATIENSTFQGNTTSDGAVIDARQAGYSLTHVTMAEAQDVASESDLSLTSTAVDGCDVTGTLASDHSFDTAGKCGLSGTGDISGPDQRLLPLADNDGKEAGIRGAEEVIQTMLPTFLSPLTNAGASLTEDQRGVARPYGPAPDIGATEWEYDPERGYDPFTDDDGSIFENDIEWIAWHEITKGCNPPTNTLFCPGNPVTREAFAAFMSRALGLTEIDPDIDFVDVPDSNIFKNDILRLATAGITKGCNPPANDEFCPKDVLSRETLAAFFSRALGLTEIDPDIDFVDVPDSNIFKNDILRLATAGITKGCNPPTNDMFCPGDDVKRDTFAAFMKRSLRPGG